MLPGFRWTSTKLTEDDKADARNIVETILWAAERMLHTINNKTRLDFDGELIWLQSFISDPELLK